MLVLRFSNVPVRKTLGKRRALAKERKHAGRFDCFMIPLWIITLFLSVFYFIFLFFRTGGSGERKNVENFQPAPERDRVKKSANSEFV